MDRAGARGQVTNWCIVFGNPAPDSVLWRAAPRRNGFRSRFFPRVVEWKLQKFHRAAHRLTAAGHGNEKSEKLLVAVG